MGQIEIGRIDVTEQFVAQRHILPDQRLNSFQIDIGLIELADQLQDRELIGAHAMKLEHLGLREVIALEIIKPQRLAKLLNFLRLNALCHQNN